jgi:hypothetical protein
MKPYELTFYAFYVLFVALALPAIVILLAL